MASERSLQLAAQAWCGEKTSSTEMDTDLATAFAEILDKEDERAKVSETRVYAKLAQAEAERQNAAYKAGMSSVGSVVKKLPNNSQEVK